MSFNFEIVYATPWTEHSYIYEFSISVLLYILSRVVVKGRYCLSKLKWIFFSF